MCIRKINELLNQDELITHSVQLGGELHGFVYKSRKGRIHMFVDNTLSPIAFESAKIHEAGHILKHVNQACKMIGINNVNKKIEDEADCFAHNKNLHQLSAEM